MDALSKRHSYVIESEEAMEECYVKDYTEAEAEEYLRVEQFIIISDKT